MVTLSVRNLPDEVHRSLCGWVALRDRSTDREMCAFLEETTLLEERIPLGLVLTAVG